MNRIIGANDCMPLIKLRMASWFRLKFHKVSSSKAFVGLISCKFLSDVFPGNHFDSSLCSLTGILSTTRTETITVKEGETF